MTYVVLAQRLVAVSVGSAIGVWIVLASIIRLFDWIHTAGFVNLVAFGICIPLLAKYRHAKMPLVTRRWYDIPFRASLVATLVAIVVSTSGWRPAREAAIVAAAGEKRRRDFALGRFCAHAALTQLGRPHDMVGSGRDGALMAGRPLRQHHAYDGLCRFLGCRRASVSPASAWMRSMWAA